MERNDLLYALNEAIEERKSSQIADEDVTIVETAIDILSEDANTLASYNESEQLTILEAAVEVLTEANAEARYRKKKYEESKKLNDLVVKNPVLKKYISEQDVNKYAPKKYNVNGHESESFKVSDNGDEKYVEMAAEIANKDNRSIINGLSFATKKSYDKKAHDGYFEMYSGAIDFSQNPRIAGTNHMIFNIMYDTKIKVNNIITHDNSTLDDRINSRTDRFNRKDPSKASTQHESALAIIFGNNED